MAQLVKNPCAHAEDARDTSLIPGLGRSTGKGNGTPVQYSCLENPMDGGACQATVHGAAESDMTKCVLSLSHTQTHNFTVDLQCCVSFMSTAKWISYTYTYVHSFLRFFFPYRLIQNPL